MQKQLSRADNTQGFTIFAVDDEPIVHKMLARIIEDSGLPVSLIGAASSGDEALAMLPQLRPDICLLDIHMDGMNGLELASRLPAVLDYSPRIIYLTAYSTFEYAQKAVKLGATDYILKPINRKELITALRSATNTIQAERLDALDRSRLREQVQSVMPAAVSSADAADESKNIAIAKIARQYIDEHYAEKMTLAGAADKVNLSPGYLGTLFKAAFGLSFRAYLRSVRVARAKELLNDRSLNISQIALAVGYEDLNYFSEAFLQETGARPSEYRGGGRRWAK